MKLSHSIQQAKKKVELGLRNAAGTIKVSPQDAASLRALFMEAKEIALDPANADKVISDSGHATVRAPIRVPIEDSFFRAMSAARPGLVCGGSQEVASGSCVSEGRNKGSPDEFLSIRRDLTFSAPAGAACESAKADVTQNHSFRHTTEWSLAGRREVLKVEQHNSSIEHRAHLDIAEQHDLHVTLSMSTGRVLRATGNAHRRTTSPGTLNTFGS
jgi:hypothetical protein